MVHKLYLNKMIIKKKIGGEFTDSTMVKTLCSHFWGPGFNPSLEN